jgi:8-oxo-dGTP pyrophosphatase MutT (NUDIX family)
MSFLERIRAVNTGHCRGFRPFRVDGVVLGWIRDAFAAELVRQPEVFRMEGGSIVFASDVNTPALRTVAVAGVVRQLHQAGVIRDWRNELYAVKRRFADPPSFLLERAAVPLFGVQSYGVHVNGYVRTPDGLSMWLGQRARDRMAEPGKLDQLVAGGQPAGLDLKANVVKEAWEEAGIPAALAERAIPVGAVSYCREVALGLRPDVLFIFDLELPADFQPVNQDGEVEAFLLLPLGEILEIVRDSEAFKFNCALVVIDFLIRHGVISPEEPDYLNLLQGLRANSAFREDGNEGSFPGG